MYKKIRDNLIGIAIISGVCLIFLCIKPLDIIFISSSDTFFIIGLAGILGTAINGLWYLRKGDQNE
ncbi:MAG: hypothetical protein ACRCUS_05360 [Anaerovoracaceae bacterium]